MCTATAMPMPTSLYTPTSSGGPLFTPGAGGGCGGLGGSGGVGGLGGGGGERLPTKGGGLGGEFGWVGKSGR